MIILFHWQWGVNSLSFCFSLFSSLLISPHMQILTQEDWNSVLYNGMASTTPLAALYFVALMTFGNYVLFNLLVAILVEGFQAEVRANTQSLLRESGRENETNWALLCWWYQSCLQENNLQHPLCVVLSSLSTPLSLFHPALVYPSLFRYLPFFHTFANTHNTLQGRDVFDIACHSQLVSFCCLVFIIYLQHQRTHAPSLSFSHLLFPALSYVLILSYCDTHTHTQIPFLKAVCLHLSSMNFN